MLTKEPNNLSLSSNEEREKQPRKRASRLPEDWQPSAEDFAYCRKQRPDLDPYEVAAAFRDYWHASGSKTAAKLDWAAAWRTWVRNEKKSLKTPAFESAKDAQRRAVLESFTSSQPPLIDITPPTDDPFTLT